MFWEQPIYWFMYITNTEADNSEGGSYPDAETMWVKVSA